MKIKINTFSRHVVLCNAFYEVEIDLALKLDKNHKEKLQATISLDTKEKILPCQ